MANGVETRFAGDNNFMGDHLSARRRLKFYSILRPALRLRAVDGGAAGGNDRRLLFIRRARDLGFSIEAIKDLFRLADVSFSSPAEALRIAKEQLAAVEEKIAQLETLEKMIQLVAESENDGDLIPLDILPLKDTSRDGDAEVKTSSKGRESIH